MNVYDLQASLTLNKSEYEKALKNAVSEGQELADSAFGARTGIDELEKAINEAKDTVDSFGTDIDKTNQKTQGNTDETRKNTEETEKNTRKKRDNNDETDKSTGKTQKNTEAVKKASEAVKDLSGKLGKDLKSAVKVGAAAVGTIATATAAATAKAVKEFAQYEQLVGGVDTLFKNSSQEVQRYADDAFRTAGMSANQYMETVTAFSASLLQSLGGDTKKAADIGDMAIRDMSDNANKMGTSMDSIQFAYQGFAKQNYTINLMSAA